VFAALGFFIACDLTRSVDQSLAGVALAALYHKILWRYA